MKPSNEGGPAFPVLRESGNPDMPLFMTSAGMTLRDYFAGISISLLIESPYAMPYLEGHDGSEEDHDQWVAKRSYEIADAMLAAREVQP